VEPVDEARFTPGVAVWRIRAQVVYHLSFFFKPLHPEAHMTISFLVLLSLVLTVEHFRV
jgi:hypothetical protein